MEEHLSSIKFPGGMLGSLALICVAVIARVGEFQQPTTGR